ncbi:sensor histidine kinase [Kitasatospora sp. NPDC058397]|uniref:sensor histidine kinase n=1 Tax=unclassified Kitasatospora TaxID=2633591 RepID=UPI00364AC6BF
MPRSTGAAVTSAADYLDSRRADILRTYRAGLREIGSVLDSQEDTWQELERQAGQVISVCVATLARGVPVPDRVASDPLELINAGRAVRHLHPIEALRANSLLFDVIMAETTKALDRHPNSEDLLGTMAHVLNRSVNQRAEAMMTGYDAFLYRRFKDGHLAERRRLAREIHDHISNSVSAALRGLELYEIYRDNAPTVAADRFDQARAVLLEALSAMHSTIAELRMFNPPGTVASGLQTFLASVQNGGMVDIRVTGNECWLPGEHREQIFVIIREALRNIFAHSHATRATVRLDVTPHCARVVIEDEGVGFDVATVLAQGRSHGLASMHERTELLCGRMRLASVPDVGTVIDLSIPLPPCECDHEDQPGNTMPRQS